MKSWQIFVAGTAILIAAVLLPAYESLLAGLAAIALVIAAAAGFAFRPRREVFYLRTTLVLRERDHAVCVEHDRLAVRVELARLWLLFLPTFGALAFLVVTSAKGTTWKFSILGEFAARFSYPLFLVIRLFMLVVVGILSTWLSERWVLRDAEACSADMLSHLAGRLLYSFKDRAGEYYGGECFPFALERSELGRIVFYKVHKPQLNKIAMGCLFHRVVIVGRGLTELDAEKAVTGIRRVQPAAQSS
jgi:hypothetical protein